MATLKYGSLTYTVDHAVKGADYIHGYAADNRLVVAFDGVKSFDDFEYDGAYMAPEECLEEACNVLKQVRGKYSMYGGYKLVNSDGSDVKCMAFGNRSEAHATGAVATGSYTYESGAEYLKDDEGRYYVISADCELAKSCEGQAAGFKVVGVSPGFPVTSDGGIVPPAEIRGQSAYGTGSTASGMGAIAFARASHSLGYRTQTGYPTAFNHSKAAVHELIEVLVPGASETYFQPYDGIEQQLLFKGLKVQYINELFVLMHYKCKLEDGDTACLRFIFSNSCCDDISRVDIPLSDTEEKELRLPKVVQVPSLATVVDLYVVIVPADELNQPSCELIDLAITKYPKDNYSQGCLAMGADTVALGKHSFAGGLRCISRGDNSFAFGFNDPAPADGSEPTWTEANGDFSFAFGLNCHSNALGSFTFGEGNITNNAYAFALGQLNTTNAAHSLAFGKSNNTKGQHSIAVGYSNATDAKYAVAIGNSCVAINTYAVALGYACHAYGMYSFAAGSSCVAGTRVYDSATNTYKLSGDGAVAFGIGNHATFYGTFAYGQGNVASAYNALAGGSLSCASYDNSMAVGRGVITGAKAQAVVGKWNDFSDTALFVVGNGTAEDKVDESGNVTKKNRSNAFAVLSNGALVVGAGCYGDTLPSTGVKGQLFFLKV